MIRRFLISIKLAIKNLQHNIGRTILTLVGIVIGIMLVIVVMSSGEGVKNFVLGQFQSYGNDEIAVKIKIPAVSKMSTATASSIAQGVQITTLKIDDKDALTKLPNVDVAAAMSIGQELISYQNVNKQTMLYGEGADSLSIDSGAKVAEGSFFTDAQDNSLEQVVVIGPDLAQELFGQDEAVGKMIKIKNLNFKVIGVMQKRGAASFFNYDELAYIPIQTMQKKLQGIEYVQAIMVKVKDPKLVDVTVLDITDELRRQHKITDPNKDDFSVTSMQEAENLVSNVFGTINILLLALTSISLIVGGVGIMNVMYVAVAERTFEIGLRKAVGAKAADIRNQFLLEAVIVTVIGGIVGIILGYLLSLGFSYLFSLLGFALEFSVTLSSVLVATGFSAATGIIFGLYPAYKASKLSPMEALRKE